MQVTKELIKDLKNCDSIVFRARSNKNDGYWKATLLIETIYRQKTMKDGFTRMEQRNIHEGFFCSFNYTQAKSADFVETFKYGAVQALSKLIKEGDSLNFAVWDNGSDFLKEKNLTNACLMVDIVRKNIRIISDLTLSQGLYESSNRYGTLSDFQD